MSPVIVRVDEEPMALPPLTPRELTIQHVARRQHEHGYAQRAKEKFLPSAKLFQGFYLRNHVIPW